MSEKKKKKTENKWRTKPLVCCVAWPRPRGRPPRSERCSPGAASALPSGPQGAVPSHVVVRAWPRRCPKVSPTIRRWRDAPPSSTIWSLYSARTRSSLETFAARMAPRRCRRTSPSLTVAPSRKSSSVLSSFCSSCFLGDAHAYLGAAAVDEVSAGPTCRSNSFVVIEFDPVPVGSRLV